MYEIGVLKVSCSEKIGLQALFRARDDSGVVSKQQPTQDCHQNDAVEVAFVSLFCIHNMQV